MDLAAAREYDALRPRYPKAAVEAILGAASTGDGSLRVADVGAGTGILTRQLLAEGRQRVAWVHAVEPSRLMTQVLEESVAVEAELRPRLQIHLTSAEDTGLEEGAVDVVVAAQAWHWFEAGTVQREAHRLLVEGGALAIVSNHLDTSDPWVHRLTRIIRAGDVHRPGWSPPLNPRLFARPRTEEFTWSRRLTADDVRRLAATMSSWLRAGPKERARRRENLDWYLGEHTGLAGDDVVELPYLTVLHTAGTR
ncbi:class I SAM-dependent methyltransferase [Nesterenkonia sp. PF2B19]|uniref:class I SAM-dependent methyltransferase n=1 Tax=Nesterenkonia sp. PF2B19 TaxID=1881858 RepID=UPI000872407F|nr:class I SAM-dependent methyltransferase [Nesterenkonia sp. PF2B19]OSM42520.1 hypothetical protein BCY76_013930 [Nesterenkonia sp. PF2B19]